MNCPNCNQPVADGIKFCINCGANLSEAAAAKPAEAKKSPAFDLSALKQIPKKYLAIGGIGVVAIIAIILVFALIIPALSGPAAYALYIKENEMMMSKLPGGKAWQVTDKLLEDSDDWSDSATAELAFEDLSWGAVKVSKDGKKIFYADKLDSYSDSYDLYYKSTSASKSEGIKIASGIASYTITPNGKTVIYKDASNNLYTHDLKEKTKIASDVYSYRISDDGKKFYWTDDEMNLYYKNGNKDKEKIASEIEYIEYVNEKFSSIYYVKDDNLYLKQTGKDKVKIASDIVNVYAVYEDGSAYYTKAGDDTASTLWDYVEDDMAKKDEATLDAGYPDYDDFDDWDEYYEAQDEYYAAQNRESLRESLKDWEISVSVSTLCYYTGKEEKKITTEFVSSKTYSSEKAVMVYATQAQDDVEAIKLSEVEYSSDVYDLVMGDDANSNYTMYVAVEDTATQFDQENATNFSINEKANTIIYLDAENSNDEDEDEDEDANDVATLYKMEISGSKAKKPEKYDDDVSTSGSIGFYDKDSILYFKDVEDYAGELYIDKKSVDSDVYLSYAKLDEDSGKIYYMTEYDSEDGYGTLKMYNGKKAVKVYEEVAPYFVVTHKGDVLFLYDYSEKHYTGELWFFSGSKAKKLDEDVSGIISYTYVDGKN